MGRYEERLALLERLATRLEEAGVPTRMDRFTPNSAPRDESESWIPALRVGEDGAHQVRVLYWTGTPMYVYRDLVTRYRADDAGVAELAALITRQWREPRRRSYARHAGGGRGGPDGAGGPDGGVASEPPSHTG